MRTTEASWCRTIETSLGVSFETYLRRWGDVLMGRRYYVPLRRCHDIPIRRREDELLRCLDDVPLRRRWVFLLRHTCDVAGTYRETLLRRLIAGWVSSVNHTKKSIHHHHSTSSVLSEVF